MTAPDNASLQLDESALVAALTQQGFYTSEDITASAYARILLLGPGKVGKTTAIATTAPGPIAIINCDGDSSTHYAALQRKRRGLPPFLELQARNRRQWAEARAAIKKAVAAGVRTVIVDSVSLLAVALLDEISITISDKRELYGELATQLGKLRQFIDLEAHVFFVAHTTASFKESDAEEEGIMPLIPGQTKAILPATVHDIVLFDYVQGRTPHEYTFVLGPQKNWSHKGRNIKRSCMVPATVPALFDELGLAL